MAGHFRPCFPAPSDQNTTLSRRVLDKNETIPWTRGRRGGAAPAMFERLKHAKRQDAFEERLSRAERDLNAIKIEWLDTLDRLKRMMGRVVKERARVESADPEPSHLSDEDISGGAVSLSDRAREANARILARRNRSNQ
jgi:hypothetical protein